MTNFLAQVGIGNRLQAIRKQHGIHSARALADLIPGDNVTEAVVQNIEAGRKHDLPVSQLLNIAKALRVPPIFLLAPIARPLAALDVANLSPSFDGMTVVEFDAWISGEPEGAYRWATADERHERIELQAMRELHAQLRERRRLATRREIEHTTDASASASDASRTTEDNISEVEQRIAQLRSYLVSAGWDLAEPETF
ncbi:helix-turn-helix domain-containing protein [Cryobacterium sp. N19]|uniref:helix-turn-helix domain-containing protein n=1 Tax=Cryobacterium sp. N19 TaxID=2048288 RepID=UPI000CE45E58|nr:helix-turn-helix domain-containing protein [Cryobacterium sp. N19]